MENQTEPRAIRPWLIIVLAVVILSAIGFFSWNYYQNKKKAVAPVAVIPTTTTKTPIATDNAETTASTPASTLKETPITTAVAPTPTLEPTTPTSTQTSAWKTPADGTFTIKLDANTTKTVTFKIPGDWFFEKTDTFYPFRPLIMSNKKACVDTYRNYFAPPTGCEIISISPALPGDDSSQIAGIDGYNSAESQSEKSNYGDLVIRTFTSPIVAGAFPHAIAVIGIDSSDAKYKYQETIDFSIPKGSDNSTVISTIKQIIATMTLE